MDKSLSIQTVLEKRNSYNLAIPFVESQQINPYYKLSVSLLYVDTDPDASQIYKVGSKRTRNNQYEHLYALTKPFLQRLATEAGIQFAPGTGDVSKMDENTWRASAFGALRMPDGCVRTSSNFKVINLVTEEKKYRLAYEKKSVNRITDDQEAKAAAEKYKGEWFDTAVKEFLIAEDDRDKYIEDNLSDTMAHLRASAPQNAATGAILRVIRDLLGVKGAYTIEELKKPFAVARMTFSPDYNDPAMKQIMVTHTISRAPLSEVEEGGDVPH